ncbi:MAG: acyl-CoA dehydrogenase family protein [Gammaproteobacteria bacterium]
MNFELSAEQQLIQDSVARFVADHYALDQRQASAASRAGFSPTHWRTMAELGWLALPFSADDGGLGGNQIDTMVVMEQLGKGLVLEPYLAHVVLGGGALRRAGLALRAEFLPGVIDGTRQLALAYAELQARFDLDDVVTSARADGAEFVLNGQKSMVLHGGSAHQLVVSARTSGGQRDTRGITLFLVDADSPGLARDAFPTVDGLRAAELRLTDVRVPAARVIGTVDDGYPILEAVAIDAMLALAAEAVGAMEVLYKDTVAYTQAREQFDHPLSDFQVLQHRMVDMFMNYEQSVSITYMVTLKLEASDAERRKAASAAKVQIGKAGRFIGQQAVQLHGGMGMTDELNVGHYFKRLTMIDTMFGNVDHHLKRYSAAA